jgi:hypothetical protein
VALSISGHATLDKKALASGAAATQAGLYEDFCGHICRFRAVENVGAPTFRAKIQQKRFK